MPAPLALTLADRATAQASALPPLLVEAERIAATVKELPDYAEVIANKLVELSPSIFLRRHQNPDQQ